MNQPDIVPVPSLFRPRYMLRSAYVAHWEGLRGPQRVWIPAEYRWDGSTEWLVAVVLPWLPAGLLWLLGIRADGPHRAAALVHDWLGHTRTLPRDEVDWAFFQLCLMGGVPRPLARLRWAVLRLTGWIPWQLRRKVV